MLKSSYAICFLVLISLAVPRLTSAYELPPAIQAGEHKLVLNGEGSRNKAVWRLYVAGLYLLDSSNDASRIVAADEPMSIRIKITSDWVSQEALVESLQDGFKNATNGRTKDIDERILQFRKCFQEKITKGDVFDLTYLPKHGVVVNKNGRMKGVIPGADFKQALFGIWLSANPADKSLKQAMLQKGSVR